MDTDCAPDEPRKTNTTTKTLADQSLSESPKTKQIYSSLLAPFLT